MFGPPRGQVPQMRWGYQRPPQSHQWRHPPGPRGPFRGHQRFNFPRPAHPENDNYWCETCDRGFPTADILNKHKQQHQKCNIDGCQFIAHPKVITKHIQMQHSTGLYKKIANLKNPEEIEKWREERRRRYPTKANIDKKAAERQEKIDRGEKMGLERDRNHRNKPNSDQDYKPGQGVKRRFDTRHENQPRSKFRKNNPMENNNKAPPPKAKPKPTPVIVEDNRLKPFAGILNLQMDSDNEIENDSTELNGLIEDEDDSEEFKAEIEKNPETTEPVVCGALTSLMCDYGSSGEEDNSEIQTDLKLPSGGFQNSNHNKKSDQVIKPGAKYDSFGVMKFKTNKKSIDTKDIVCKQPVEKDAISDDSGPEIKSEMSKTICNQNVNIKYDDEIKKDTGQETIRIEDDSDSGPEETKVDVKKEDISEVSVKSKMIEVKKKIVKGRMQVNQRRKPKLPSTLLQKLLHREMQQERNIVLQCIRYIRRNNYFDKKE